MLSYEDADVNTATTQQGSWRKRRGNLLEFLGNHLEEYFAANPDRILVVDNVAFHGTKAVQELMSIDFLYLPPHSPTLNPIEESFSVAKSRYRSLYVPGKPVDPVVHEVNDRDNNAKLIVAGTMENDNLRIMVIHSDCLKTAWDKLKEKYGKIDEQEIVDEIDNLIQKLDMNGHFCVLENLFAKTEKAGRIFTEAGKKDKTLKEQERFLRASGSINIREDVGGSYVCLLKADNSSLGESLVLFFCPSRRNSYCGFSSNVFGGEFVERVSFCHAWHSGI